MHLCLRYFHKISDPLLKVIAFVTEAKAQLKHDEAERIRRYNLGDRRLAAQASVRSLSVGCGLSVLLLACLVAWPAAAADGTINLQASIPLRHPENLALSPGLIWLRRLLGPW